jgi:hypothetical protein
MGWYVVPALEDLRYQLNEFFPDRDKSSDGSIGDYEHQQGDSSHNPDDTGHGNAEWDSDSDSKQEVRARDFDKDLRHPDITAQDVVDHLVAGAKRGEFWWLRYIIYNRKMYHRDDGWTAKSYSGSNSHEMHFHVNNAFTQDADNVSGVDYHLEELFPEDDMDLDDNLFSGAPSDSWTSRYPNSASTVRNAMAFAAYDSYDAEKVANQIKSMLNDLGSAVVSIAEKVEVNAAKLAELRASLASANDDDH